MICCSYITAPNFKELALVTPEIWLFSFPAWSHKKFSTFCGTPTLFKNMLWLVTDPTFYQYEQPRQVLWVSVYHSLRANLLSGRGAMWLFLLGFPYSTNSICCSEVKAGETQFGVNISVKGFSFRLILYQFFQLSWAVAV